MSEDSLKELPSEATQVVGRAIQDLAAARLGRAFVPLAMLFIVGLVQMFMGQDAFILAAGAPISAGAMLAYGLRIVQRAFARPARPWMVFAMLAALLPPAFGVYVLGWLGLRGIAENSGLGDAVLALVLSGLGIWVLRGWVQLLELHRLAETMVVGSMDRGEGE